MKLPNPLSGTNPLVGWLNSLRNFAASCRLKSGVDYRVEQTTDGTVLRFYGGNGGGSTIKMYRLIEEKANHIVCHTWDGTAEGSDSVLIAKPYKLRNSITSALIAGETIDYTYVTSGSTAYHTRDADDGTNVETQVVIPYFLPKTTSPAYSGDLIYAADVSHTGVTVDDVELTKIDINADARAWARKYE